MSITDALQYESPVSRITAVDVEIVVPVFNEEAVLAPSILRLATFLRDTFPFTYRIVIADNASTDGTWLQALRLAKRFDRVEAVHLDEKGRGRALKQAWLNSTAKVVAYMDVDLSTDLNALLPLIAPLMTGHSDMSIGTRLNRSSHVKRSRKRELISRCYNFILHTTTRAHFSDAQCGFKAVRTETVRPVLQRVQDTGWFFDTELLILAQRNGMRIHEVPVDWIEDPNTKVDLVDTAIKDLRGVWRMKW